MWLTSKKERVFSFITGQKVFFISYKNGLTILKEFNIQDILSSPQLLIDEALYKQINLLVIPDYWLTNEFYSISSKRDSVIEAFLNRRLPIDYPDIPDSKDFFEYFFYKKDD